MIIETVTNSDWLDGLEYWTDDSHAQNIDLAGISFEMEMRAAPQFATVVLRASTDNGFIRVYANSWQFLIPSTMMMSMPPGLYVFDMLGRADGYTRNLVQATVQVDLGITRTDSPPILAPVPA